MVTCCSGGQELKGGWVKQEWVWELGPLSMLTLSIQPLPTPGVSLDLIRSRGSWGSELTCGHHCNLVFEKPFALPCSLGWGAQTLGKGSFINSWSWNLPRKEAGRESLQEEGAPGCN